MADPAGAVGTWVKLSGPEPVELLALAGADFVIVDLANSALDMGDVNRQVPAARAGGVDCYARVPEGSDHSCVGRLLDTGVVGVIVPHVDDVPAARTYVDAAYFPPQGSRGMGGTTRGGGWLLDGLAGYLAEPSPSLLGPVSIVIESREALAAIDEIARLPGLGSVFAGPADLSAALGVMGKLDHPLLTDALERIARAAASAGVPAATAVGTPAAAHRMFDLGYVGVAVANDATLLGQGARALFDQARPSTVTSPG